MDKCKILDSSQLNNRTKAFIENFYFSSKTYRNHEEKKNLFVGIQMYLIYGQKVVKRNLSKPTKVLKLKVYVYFCFLSLGRFSPNRNYCTNENKNPWKKNKEIYNKSNNNISNRNQDLNSQM
jgi:hypothetical protein